MKTEFMAYVGDTQISPVAISDDNFTDEVFEVFSSKTFVFFPEQVNENIVNQNDIKKLDDQMSLDEILDQDVLSIENSTPEKIQELVDMYEQITNKELHYLIHNSI
jgi:hypothetical protein